MARPINVVIKGDYSDRDIKRAIRDLRSLDREGDKVARSAAKVGGSVKRSLVGLGAGLVAGWGLSRVADGLGSAVTAASDLAEAQAKVDVVFGQSAARVKAWAETSSTAILMTKQQALEAAGTYGNLLQAFGIGRPEAERMSTTLVQLAADLASFNNTSVDDAIIALRSGLSGETEPLKRYGVAINDARLKEQARTLGIYEGVGALNVAQKSEAAYALILKDSALAQGDVARNMDGYANSVRALGAGVGDLQAAMGTGFLDGFFGAFDEGTTSVEGAVEAMKGAEGTLRGVTMTLGSLAASALGWMRDFGRGAMMMDYAVTAAALGIARAEVNLRDFFGAMSDEEAEAYRRSFDLQDQQARAAIANYDLVLSGQAAAGALGDVGAAAGGAGGALGGVGDDADDAAAGLDDATTAADKFKKALDRLNGANIDVGRSRIELERALSEGPDKSGQRKVSKPGEQRVVFDAKGRRRVVAGPATTETQSYSTRDDVKLWAYDVAEQAMSTAEDYYSRDGKGDRRRGRDVLAETRKSLIARLREYGYDNPEKFVRRILSSPTRRQAGEPAPGVPLGISPQERGEGFPRFGMSGFGGGEFQTPVQQWWDTRRWPTGSPTPAPAAPAFDDYPALGTAGSRAGSSGGTTINIERVEVASPTAWDQMVKEAQKRVRRSGGRFTYPASVMR